MDHGVEGGTNRVVIDGAVDAKHAGAGSAHEDSAKLIALALPAGG